MTVQLKVKGYINGEEWGVNETQPAPTLLEYNVFKDAAIAEGYQWPDSLAILNEHPAEYYDKYNTEGHYINTGMYGYRLDGITHSVNTGSDYYVYMLRYNQGNNQRGIGQWHGILD